MSTSPTENKSFDLSRRRLCPDGSCIGLLDESGRCKECGQVAGAARSPAPAPLAVEDADLDDVAAGTAAEAGADDAPAFDPSRRLCPDGSCVGVLDAAGRCGVCGRTAEG
jgi:hypothetical protein